MILQECPYCHKKQGVRNKLCKCGADLDKAKRSKKVKYWITYRLPGGKQRRESVGYFIEEAKDAEGKRRSQKRENRLFDIKADAKMTFRQLAEWYLNIESIKAKPSYRQMKIRVNNLNSEIGNMIIAQIKPVDLENYQTKRKKKGLSDAYIDDEITQAKMIINKAFENDMIGGETLKAFKTVKKLLKTNANARDRILSPEEFHALMSHSPIHLMPILAIGYYTGMREGEALGLVWRKVDLKNRLIQLEAMDTKTGEPRKAPICDALYKILNAVPRAIHDPHVFLYKGKPIKEIKSSLKTACKKAGIIYGRKQKGGFTYHDLRHTFNTYMRKAGVDKEVIKAITGHNTDAMYTRYNKIDVEDIQKAAGQFEVFLQSVDQNVDQANESKT